MYPITEYFQLFVYMPDLENILTITPKRNSLKPQEVWKCEVLHSLVMNIITQLNSLLVLCHMQQ